MIIGNVDQFAIEIADYNKIKSTAKVRMLFGSKTFGSFKKKNDLKELTKSLTAIINTGDELYDESFDGKTELEIFETILVLPIGIEEWTLAQSAQYERYKRFTFFGGEQFSDVSAVAYVKNGICNVLWSTNRTFSQAIANYSKNLKIAQVPLEIIARTRDEFVHYLKQQ
jgi:hypothetical protein